MWDAAAAECWKAGLKPPGSYDKFNQTGGHMPCLPGDCHVTDRQADDIIYAAGKSRLPGFWPTETQMRKAMRATSFIKQIQGGLAGEQFKGVKRAWECINVFELAEPKGSSKADPVRTPTSQELYKVFKGRWHPTMCPLPVFCQERLALWDTGVCGGRKEDLERVKFSCTHDVNQTEGYCKTDLLNGRAKLTGKKKGRRPWSMYRVCMCAGGAHTCIPGEVEFLDWTETSPPCEVTWDTGCPLNCFEFLRRLQLVKYPEFKCYRKWLPGKGKGFSANNEGPVLKTLAFKHFKRFGIDREFDLNSGRKLCARWTRLEELRFRVVFEMIGDLEVTWRRWYDTQLPQDGYSVRTQSRNPDIACAALYAFARACDRGIPKVPKLRVLPRLVLELLDAMGRGAKGRAIIRGEPECKRRRFNPATLKAAHELAAEDADEPVFDHYEDNDIPPEVKAFEDA